jgi:hypothetical protein
MNSSSSVSDQADVSRSSPAFRCALAVTAIAFFGLGIWALSPIYPDEIAFRQDLGRLVPDHGVVYGLYQMCPSNIKTVPLVFKPVAWPLAVAMRMLSPLEMRILSFMAVLAVVFTASRQAAGSRNPAARFLVLASFVGVAGAALICVRYEFALELHLLSCLVAAARLTRRRTGIPGDLGVATGLILGAALSMWSHPQGLLLLPLTSYLLARLAVRRFGSIGLIAGVAPFVLFVPPALTRHFVCTEHPQIEAVMGRLHFDASDLGLGHLALLLFHGAHLYIRSFLYAASYPIGFLPGVDAATDPMKATNFLVSVVLVFMGGLAICIPAVALFRFCKSFRSRPRGIALSELFEKNEQFVVAALIAIPVVILFVYDPLHAFYRNYYLNHLASVAACLMFASLSGRAAVQVTKGACAIIGIAVGASLIATSCLFVPPLWDGYEGPSLSVFRSWSQVANDTEKLAGLCKMDLKRGRIVVDDLTQAGVFSRQVTIPVTYLAVQAEFIGMSVHEAAISVKANYAILRCPYFGIFLKVEPQGKVGDICCYTFS